MIMRRLKPLISLILLLTLIGTLPISADAAYENTYKNTGNMRNDIIGVALTQVGYREGNNNYTKYGVWFGQANSPWCGIFVSWCANQAGIPTSIIRRNGIAHPSNFGLSYKNGSSYRPQKGDLFFTKTFSHTGLVYYTDGDYFYTVEGNTNTVSGNGIGVFIRRRKISDYYFSSPNYRNSGSGGSHNYKIGYDTKHPHKQYKYCSHCSDKYYTGKTQSSDSCTTCIQASCSHKYSAWSKSSSTKHVKTCTKCGKKVTEEHKWKDGEVLKEPNCKKTGKQQQVCSSCNATKTITLKVTDIHTYSSAKYLDETMHQMTCSVCGKKSKSDHTTEGWSADQTNHWKICTLCFEPLKQGAHDFPAVCGSSCNVCDFVQSGTHSVGEVFAYDETNHWKICEKCGSATNSSEHTYSSDCDISCESCDYIREPVAEHSNDIFKDKTGHWTQCSVCGFLSETIEHNPDAKARNWETLACTDCGYILRSADEHEHSYSSVEYDNQYHWGSCECGEVMPQDVHTWDVSTGICSDCNAVYEPELSDDSAFIIYIGSGVVALIAIPTIIVLIVKLCRKKRI